MRLNGRSAGIRTLDPVIKSHLLYQLSYAPIHRFHWSEERDSNPRQPPWQGGTLPTELSSHLQDGENYTTHAAQFARTFLTKKSTARLAEANTSRMRTFILSCHQTGNTGVVPKDASTYRPPNTISAKRGIYRRKRIAAAIEKAMLPAKPMNATGIVPIEVCSTAAAIYNKTIECIRHTRNEHAVNHCVISVRA